MANPIVSFPTGVQGGPSRATAFISTNTRARTPRGSLGLATDVVVFPSATGTWVFTNQRVRVSGVATVGSTSFGQYVDVNQNTGLMSVVQGDPKAAGL